LTHTRHDHTTKNNTTRNLKNNARKLATYHKFSNKAPSPLNVTQSLINISYVGNINLRIIYSNMARQSYTDNNAIYAEEANMDIDYESCHLK